MVRRGVVLREVLGGGAELCRVARNGAVLGSTG